MSDPIVGIARQAEQITNPVSGRDLGVRIVGSEDEDRGVDEHGRILRDNVFGSQAEDASRRPIPTAARPAPTSASR